MKKKISRFLGVGLALVMVLTLAVAFSPISAVASPDENEWSKFSYPEEGADGDWFRDAEIGAIGPIARASDGTLYTAISKPRITIDGIIAPGEWDGYLWFDETLTNTFESPSTMHVHIYMMNDANNLYVALDIPDIFDMRTHPEVPEGGSDTFGLNIGVEGEARSYSRILQFNTTDRTGNPDWFTLDGYFAQWAEATSLTNTSEWGPDVNFLPIPAGVQSKTIINEAHRVQEIAIPLSDLGVSSGAVLRVGGCIRAAKFDGYNFHSKYPVGLDWGDAGTYAGSALPAQSQLMKSIDDGCAWEETDYQDDVEGGPIVDIACSSLDADTLYVTDGRHVYWTDDAGDSFETVADASLVDAIGSETITSLDVGYNTSDEPFVFIGTKTGGNKGSVYYVAQVGYPSKWTDLEIAYVGELPTVDVFAVAASPDFAFTKEVMAIASGGGVTKAFSNSYGTIADWDELAELQKDDSDNITTAAASRICFPEDFDTDDAYEFLVGVVATPEGDVYRVTDDDTAYDLDADVNVSSLALVGDFGATTLMAGQYDDAVVWYSDDDGDSWDETDKNPSGIVITGVAMADTETVWAATSGAEGAVSLSVDGGELFNQISLISTGITSIDSVAFSPGYASDESLFMVTSATTDSLFRFDGDNWERVFVNTLTEPKLGEIDLVQLSPDFLSDDTLFAGDTDTDTIYYSNDGGNDWTKMSRQSKGLNSWVVIDEDTIIAGGEDEVHKTNKHGRRAWDDYDVTGAGKVNSIVLSPNFASDETILLGGEGVFISEDSGESWDKVGDTIDGKTTYVAFDPDYSTNDFIYAASGAVVARCEIDTGDDWDDQTWKEFTGKTLLEMAGNASGLVISADGTLCVADSAEATETEGDTAAKGGVWRSLNPLDDMSDVVFELVGADFDLDETATLDNLQLTTGSNILWSLDDANLWTYEDLLATQVVLTSPADGAVADDPHEVTFKWKSLPDADEYILKYTDDEDWVENVISIKGLEDPVYTAKGNKELDAGTTYYWKAKVTEPLLSRYSVVGSFSTELEAVEQPGVWMPENGAQNIVINTSFGWAGVSGATGYELELATSPDFSGATTVSLSINSCASPITLNYSTTYYWRVRAVKDTAVISDWVSGAFTTMVKPVEPTPPVEITPAPPAPVLPTPTTPAYIWAIIVIGAVLATGVIVLIIRTRRVV